jgi:hypothetical protein
MNGCYNCILPPFHTYCNDLTSWHQGDFLVVNPKPSFNPKREERKETPKLRKEAFFCMFCGRAGHLDEFCFCCKRIEKRHFDYARNSHRDEFIDFLVSFKDLTIAHMLLVHERIALCLDALVMALDLIVVIVPRVGMLFLLEGLTLTLSQDSWTIHIFPIVVHVPLVQMLRCKIL